MNRRDFLHPSTLALRAGQLFDGVSGIELAPDLAPIRTDVSLLRAGCRAMATQFEVLLPYGARNAQEMFQAVFNEIDGLEQQLTVYSETSEVSQLNKRAPF